MSNTTSIDAPACQPSATWSYRWLAVVRSFTPAVSPVATSPNPASASWPDMPTVAESGVKDFDVSAWDAIVAPAGTPPAVVNRLNAAIRAALADPELRRQLLDRGSEVAPGTPQALGSFIKTEIDRWGQAVKRSGAQVD